MYVCVCVYIDVHNGSNIIQNCTYFVQLHAYFMHITDNYACNCIKIVADTISAQPSK